MDDVIEPRLLRVLHAGRGGKREFDRKRDELTTLHIGCVPAAGHVVIGPVL